MGLSIQFLFVLTVSSSRSVISSAWS